MSKTRKFPWQGENGLIKPYEYSDMDTAMRIFHSYCSAMKQLIELLQKNSLTQIAIDCENILAILKKQAASDNQNKQFIEEYILYLKLTLWSLSLEPYNYIGNSKDPQTITSNEACDELTQLSQQISKRFPSEKAIKLANFAHSLKEARPLLILSAACVLALATICTGPISIALFSLSGSASFLTSLKITYSNYFFFAQKSKPAIDFRNNLEKFNSSIKNVQDAINLQFRKN